MLYIETTIQFPTSIRQIIISYSLKQVNIKENFTLFAIFFSSNEIVIPKIKIITGPHWTVISSPCFTEFTVAYRRIDDYVELIKSSTFIKLISIDKSYHPELKWLYSMAHETIIPGLKDTYDDKRCLFNSRSLVSLHRMSHNTVIHFCDCVLPKLREIKYVSIEVFGYISNNKIRQLIAEVPDVVIYFNYSIELATQLKKFERKPNVKIIYESVIIFNDEKVTGYDIRFLKQSRIEKLVLQGYGIQVAHLNCNLLPRQMNVGKLEVKGAQIKELPFLHISVEILEIKCADSGSLKGAMLHCDLRRLNNVKRLYFEGCIDQFSFEHFPVSVVSLGLFLHGFKIDLTSKAILPPRLKSLFLQHLDFIQCLNFSHCKDLVKLTVCTDSKFPVTSTHPNWDLIPDTITTIELKIDNVTYNKQDIPSFGMAIPDRINPVERKDFTV
ncbi:unnamed protein product [Ambrosiozyma monospora]|uniref:Unnamed protein product n=1 Tax=Ambrosiozyma monospora TaxID=43982 RepID=A0A9W6YVW2_AMBMO|nr:unnamed protein product [Ambrosiozyma monospora]